MKLLLFHLFITIILLGHPYFCSAQGQFGKVTSQTSGFIKYGMTPVSYYSGKINVEIPIYTLQDPDFPFPISLSYTSDGFKPAKHPGFVGLDWVLNYGGVITREVYGAPDDANGSYGSDPGSNVGAVEKGFWYAMKEKKYSEYQLWNFSAVECGIAYCDLPAVDGYFYDCQPDLFLFRFPGGSGSFMIDNDGGIKSSILGLKVDFSNFTKQTEQALEVLPSTITITDLNGYKYTFGSSVSAMEYRRVMNPTENLPFSKQYSTVMAWYLVKVQAPNGRILTISYDSRLGYPADSPFWQASSTNNHLPIRERGYSAIKGVFPQKITIPDTNVSVEFVKSIETCRAFYNGFVDYNYPTFQLDTINVTYNNKIMYTYQLEYENRKHLRFLKNVRMPDSGVYELVYLHHIYPEPDITNVDFWGYWKGPGSGIILNPELPISPPTSLETTSSSSVGFSSSESAASLLQKISYPTGGSTEFGYESNHYRRRVDTNSRNGYIPTLVESVGIAGGYRVVWICDKTDKEAIGTYRKFSYEDSAGKETGILNQYPPFIIIEGRNDSVIKSDVWYNNYNIEDNHIGYSVVKESLDDGSKINYTFSDYVSNPDKLEMNFRLNPGDDNQVISLANINKASSASQERGHLVDKEYFDAVGRLVRKESYAYRNASGAGTAIPEIPDDEILSVPDIKNYVVSYRPSPGGGFVKKIYLKAFPLTRSIIRTYYSNNRITIEDKNYRYDAWDQLRKTREITSDGKFFKKIFAYPKDLQVPSDPQNIYTQMVNRNIINNPVLEESYLDGKRLSSYRTTYRMNNNLIVKDTVWSAKGNNPYEFSVAYPLYNSYGYALLEVTRNGEHTLRLWGYKHQYLIAEIRNFKRTDVQRILNIINPYILERQSVPDFSFIVQLRIYFQYLHIYLYVYSPLVGVTSVTAPNGTITNYQYDSAGRLIIVRDDQNKVTNHYDYHYRPN